MELSGKALSFLSTHNLSLSRMTFYFPRPTAKTRYPHEGPRSLAGWKLIPPPENSNKYAVKRPIPAPLFYSIM